MSDWPQSGDLLIAAKILEGAEHFIASKMQALISPKLESPRAMQDFLYSF